MVSQHGLPGDEPESGGDVVNAPAQVYAEYFFEQVQRLPDHEFIFSSSKDITGEQSIRMDVRGPGIAPYRYVTVAAKADGSFWRYCARTAMDISLTQEMQA